MEVRQMLRRQSTPWWRRLFAESLVPAYVVVREDSQRRCPECSAGYRADDQYCPACHVATPEWRFG